MSFLCQGNTIPQTHSRRRRDQTSPSQNRSHQGHAPTSEPKTSSCLPRASRILQEIHQELCKNSEAFNNANPHGRQIRMEGNTSLHFHQTERCHHQNTHPQIPGHNKTLYCVYGCLR